MTLQPEKKYIITETMIKRIMIRVWEDQEPDPDEAKTFEDALRFQPYTPSDERDKVLGRLINLTSERIKELKSWIKIAKINQDRKREMELLPVLGENRAWWAQLKELRAAVKDDCNKQCEDCHKSSTCPDSDIGKQEYNP